MTAVDIHLVVFLALIGTVTVIIGRLERDEPRVARVLIAVGIIAFCALALIIAQHPGKAP